MIYSDESNLLIGNVTYRTIRTIFSDYRQKLKKQSQSILQIEYRALFNPTYNYDVFMLMGLAGVAVHQIFLIAFALAILLDAKGGKYKRYLDNLKEGKNLFFGKIFAFILISIPLGLVVMSLPFVFFFAPMKGSIILFVFVSIIFILSLVFASFGLAGSFLNPLLMMQTMLPLSPILFLISGYSWPLYLMPKVVSFLAHLLPLTYFLDALRRLTLTGASFADISLQFLALTIWMCFAFIWGIWGFNRIFKKVTD